MSKRDQGAIVTSYEQDGFAPDAVVNYLALLGWSPADGQEVMTPAEVIARFDVDRVNRSAARFDVKKLTALHFEHVRRMDPEKFVELGVAYLQRAGIQTSGFPPGYVRAALQTVQEKGKLFPELAAWTDFYFTADEALVMDPEAKAKVLVPAARPVLERLSTAFAAAPEFSAPILETTLKQLAAELGVKVGALVQPCRLACTGRLVGPSLYHLMEVLGRERVVARLNRAAALIPG